MSVGVAPGRWSAGRSSNSVPCRFRGAGREGRSGCPGWSATARLRSVQLRESRARFAAGDPWTTTAGRRTVGGRCRPVNDGPRGVAGLYLRLRVRSRSGAGRVLEVLGVDVVEELAELLDLVLLLVRDGDARLGEDGLTAA